MSLKKLYAEISKVNDQDDGTLHVYGYASTNTLDSEGETISAEAMKAALPDYMKWGAVREMHQAKAAGTAIEAQVQEDGKTWFGAHIVDAEACRKVKASVYKGLSIGGRVTGRDEANKAMITGLHLVEISLVDRPANPECVLTMYKAEEIATTETAPEQSEDERNVEEIAKLLNTKAITPDGVLQLIRKSIATPEAKAEEAAPEAAPEKTVEPSAIIKAMDGLLGAGDANYMKWGQDIVAIEKAEDIIKALSELKVVAKSQDEQITKLLADRENLAKRVKELEAQPVTRSILLKAVGKQHDIVEAAAPPQAEPVLKSDGSVDEIATAIKKVHKLGAMSIYR